MARSTATLQSEVKTYGGYRAKVVTTDLGLTQPLPANLSGRYAEVRVQVGKNTASVAVPVDGDAQFDPNPKRKIIPLNNIPKSLLNEVVGAASSVLRDQVVGRAAQQRLPAAAAE